MVPGTPLGPRRASLGVQRETQELHLHLPKSIFKDWGSLLGSLGDHIFSHFGGAVFNICLEIPFKTVLDQYGHHFGSILEAFLTTFGTPPGKVKI